MRYEILNYGIYFKISHLLYKTYLMQLKFPKMRNWIVSHTHIDKTVCHLKIENDEHTFNLWENSANYK